MAQLLGTSITGTLSTTGTATFGGKVTHKLTGSGFVIGNDTYSAGLHMGSGGVNRGVYDYTLDKWMVYADASNVYLNGNATTATTATKLGTATVGGLSQPIYLSNGVPKVCSSAAPTTGGKNANFTWGTGWSETSCYVYKSALTDTIHVRMYGVYTPTADVSARALVNIGTVASGYRPPGVTAGCYYRGTTGAGAIGNCYVNGSGVTGMRVNAGLTSGTGYGFYFSFTYII